MVPWSWAVWLSHAAYHAAYGFPGTYLCYTIIWRWAGYTFGYDCVIVSHAINDYEYV